MTDLKPRCGGMRVWVAVRVWLSHSIRAGAYRKVMNDNPEVRKPGMTNGQPSGPTGPREPAKAAGAETAGLGQLQGPSWPGGGEVGTRPCSHCPMECGEKQATEQREQGAQGVRVIPSSSCKGERLS